MAECNCSGGKVLLFACSGGSNVGQISNDAAKLLDQLGAGSMYCLVGVGAKLPGFVENARTADTTVALDGCEVACAKKALEAVGVHPHVHVTTTALGVRKAHHYDYTQAEVRTVASHAVAALAMHQKGAPE